MCTNLHLLCNSNQQIMRGNGNSYKGTTWSQCQLLFKKIIFFNKTFRTWASTNPQAIHSNFLAHIMIRHAQLCLTVSWKRGQNCSNGEFRSFHEQDYKVLETAFMLTKCSCSKTIPSANRRVQKWIYCSNCYQYLRNCKVKCSSSVYPFDAIFFFVF